MQVNMTPQNNKNTSFQAIKLVKGDISTIGKIHNRFLQATIEGIKPEMVTQSHFEPKFKYTCVQMNPYQNLDEDIFIIATGKEDADKVHKNIVKALDSKISGTSFVKFILEELGLLDKPQDAKELLAELDNPYNYAELVAK